MDNPLISKKEIEEAKNNGICLKTLQNRVYTCGIDVEEAVNKPLVEKRIEWKLWKDIAVENGVSCSLFYMRLRRGWGEERAAGTKVGKRGRTAKC